MFIKKMATNVFVYWSDWGAGHLIITIGTGTGHLPTKIARRAGNLTNFFKGLGFARGYARGVCSRLEMTSTLKIYK